jgi:hypothetical protein
MDVPQFDGSGDAYWWLICIKKYFDVVGTPEDEKLCEFPSIGKHFDGHVLTREYCG